MNALCIIMHCKDPHASKPNTHTHTRIKMAKTDLDSRLSRSFRHEWNPFHKNKTIFLLSSKQKVEADVKDPCGSIYGPKDGTQ